tara:strand:- start:14064 stop:14312 length:249 start_codon:yes stop_codon:yes gene_type:complete
LRYQQERLKPSVICKAFVKTAWVHKYIRKIIYVKFHIYRPISQKNIDVNLICVVAVRSVFSEKKENNAECSALFIQSDIEFF